MLGVPTGWLPKARLVGERLTRAAVPVPVPERLTVCGLPLALSVMVTEAVRLPLAEGMNVTLIVQLAPAATLAPQLLVCAKSLELAPVSAMLVMFSVVPPLFVSVAAWALLVVPRAWLANVMLGGDKFAVGCATPVPDSEMLIVELRALLMIDMVPVTLPPTAGANSTLKVALSRACRVRGNTSPLMLKPAPVTVACETVTLRVPVFVRVTLRVRLVPTVTLPKLRLLELVAIRVNAAAFLARLRATKNRSTERTSCAERPARAYFRRFSR